jgi:glycerol-3-phosphate acyltransferase PlsX
MGGDFAPAEIVAGAVMAARSGGVQIALVGDPDKVNAELVKHNPKGLPIMPVPSEGVIMEGEPPALALRQKPKASILVATGMVKKGFVDACVSMGSTGAAMAAAAVVLGVIEGIERPCLGGPVVGLAPRTIIVDLGTNVDCRPSQLVSFAVIGDVFARQLWGIKRPRVALLSVGAEAGKGNKQVKETTDLMAAAGLNFVGNVEGYDLPTGKADVVVCDGFVGNVVMKLTEGLGGVIAERLRQQKLDQAAREIFEATNVVETYGGGPILGVNGVSVVGHGRAKADAVAKAIGTAKMSVEKGLVAQLNQRLASVKPHSQG